MFLITGGSRGIGLAVARSLVDRGESVLIHGGHDSRQLNRSLEELRSLATRPDQRVEGILADLSDSTAVESFCEKGWNLGGDIRGLVACAGSDILTQGAATWSFDRRLQSLLAVDLCATVRIARWFGKKFQETHETVHTENIRRSTDETPSKIPNPSPSMERKSSQSDGKERREFDSDRITEGYRRLQDPRRLQDAEVREIPEMFRGAVENTKTREDRSIVLIGWSGVDRGLSGEGGELFGIAKGAIHGFARSLARTLAPSVRVNVVAPGWIRTDWGAQANSTWQERIRHGTALERWGTPEEVAAVVAFLLSPESTYLNGTIIPVDGMAIH